MDFIRDDVSRHSNVFDVLKERGFIKQTTHEDEIRELLGACRGYYAMAGRLLSGRGGVHVPAAGAAVSEGGR